MVLRSYPRLRKSGGRTVTDTKPKEKYVLLKTHGSQWGPGKVHILSQTPDYAYCQPTRQYHGDVVHGTADEVTCKACRRYLPKE